MLAPSKAWQQQLEQQHITADPIQQQACQELDRIYHDLWAQVGFAARLGKAFGLKKPVQGLYLWGPVGRGKTFLMNLLCESLPKGTWQRWHFHRFMAHIHAQLAIHQGKSNPLQHIARQMARQMRVLCFDELFVQDIGDAMLLGNLLQALVAQGIVLVATSNTPPHKLYENGLQRARFMSAIHTLEQHCKQMHLAGAQDWRLKHLTHLSFYHYPHNATAEKAFSEDFEKLSMGQPAQIEPLCIAGRQIPIIRQSGGVLWCTFTALCESPRSAQDYIEIARCFHTVIVESVPTLTPEKSAAAQRFIHLIDELYDRKVKLILSAQVAIDKLYQDKPHRFAFERTASRLYEMQTESYLALPHIP